MTSIHHKTVHPQASAYETAYGNPTAVSQTATCDMPSADAVALFDDRAQYAQRSLAAFLLALMAAVACALAITCAPTTALADGGYIIDRYHLFDSNEYATLESQAEKTASTYNVGVYLLVVDNVGGSSARQYAIDYYNGNNLGLGSNRSGILFLIAVNSRDYVTITYGDGINAFTDYQIEQMEKAIVSELRHDNWYDAAKRYVEMADSTLAFRAEHGEPLDYDNAPTDPMTKLLFLAIGVLFAALIAGGRCAMMYSQMKTAREATQAGRYLDQNSFVLLSHDDSYVTSSVVATPRASSSNRGGFRGGSSIGSGGFGGSGGGKF